MALRFQADDGVVYGFNRALSLYCWSFLEPRKLQRCTVGIPHCVFTLP